MIESKISEAIWHEEETGFLAQLLTTLASNQGIYYRPEQLAQSVDFIRMYIEQVPNMLEMLRIAAKQDGVLDDVQPLLDAGESCFLSLQDGIPDNFGLAGLMDNAYLVYGLLINVPGTREKGPGLLEIQNIIRNSIGEPLASQLDERINSMLNLPDVQAALRKSGSFCDIPLKAYNSPKKLSPTFSQNQIGKPAAISTNGSIFTNTTSVILARVVVPKPKNQREGQESEVGVESEDGKSVPGYLDFTFGSDGKVNTNLQEGMVEALTLQADGKIVLAGFSNNNRMNSSFTVARYNPDGNLDSTFGGSGCLRLDSDRPSRAHAIALQADGKIVVAGEIARYTYSETDSRCQEIDAHHIFARELDVIPPRPQNSNQFDFNRYDFALARFNSDGSLDPTFGRGGWLHMNILKGTSQIYATAVQKDGKILAGGYVETNAGCFALARFNPKGDLDPSFGQGGIVIDQRGGLGDHVFSIALQMDGKIVAGGTIGIDRKSGKFALLRLNANGGPDSTFGNEGLVTVELGQNAWANAVAVQDNGKIVAVGCLKDPSEKFVVIRFDSFGNLDETFGNGGIVFADFSEPKSCATSIALQKDNKIVVAGWAGVEEEGVYGAPRVLTSVFALARYMTDGNLDPGFGSGGMLKTDIGNHAASAVAVQKDGKIITAGSQVPAYKDYLGKQVLDSGKMGAKGGGGSFALARYLNISTPPRSFKIVPEVPSTLQNPETELDSEGVSERPGDLDPSFGKNGSGVITDLDAAEARAIAVQPDGKIVVAGYVDTGQKPTFIDFVVARYNEDGSPDYTFHDTGLTTIDFGDDDKAYALALQDDGKIILAGEAVNIDNSSFDFALVRLGPDGIIDRTFGSDGVVLTDFTDGSYDSARSLVMQADGKILAAGFMATLKDGELQTQDFALARFNPDGRLDTSFGTQGKVMTDFAGGFDRAQGVAIQKDKKIVVVGGTAVVDSEITEFGVVRYNPDGILDSSFGNEGKVTTEFGHNENMANAIAIQPDGKILAGGYTANESSKVAALARYNEDGTLDPDFGDSGKVIGLFGGNDDGIYAIALQDDSKILVVGDALAFEGSGAQTQDFALVRLNTDGSFDTSFGIGGIVMTDFCGMNDIAYAVCLQSDGKMVVAGTTDTGSNKSFAIARYLNPTSKTAESILNDRVQRSLEIQRWVQKKAVQAAIDQDATRIKGHAGVSIERNRTTARKLITEKLEPEGKGIDRDVEKEKEKKIKKRRRKNNSIDDA